MGSEKKITPEQCRAARALIGMPQKDLARIAGISQPTLVSFEAGRTEPHLSTLAVLRQALEERGVIFIDANGTGPGVCLKKA